jgi:hypothetical protein
VFAIPPAERFRRREIDAVQWTLVVHSVNVGPCATVIPRNSVRIVGSIVCAIWQSDILNPFAQPPNAIPVRASDLWRRHTGTSPLAEAASMYQPRTMPSWISQYSIGSVTMTPRVANL